MINPARIRILAVGKARRGWLSDGVAIYRRRLPGLELVELRAGGRHRDAEAILAALRPAEQLVLLSEAGQTFSSAALAERLQGSGSLRLAFAIGGADGLDPALWARASWCLSLSPLTFPHELALLLLLEQLYRTLSIQQGGPYHRA